MSSELKVDKVSPATGTSTTLGDSGDTFTVPSGVTLDTSSSTLSLPSTIITSQTEKTTLVDADKFLISDSAASGALKYVQKSNLGAGIYNQLANVTISDGDASEDVQSVFSSTYRNYLILLENIQVGTNSADLQLITMKSDDSTPSEHTYAAKGHYHNSYDNNWSGSNSSNITIMQGQGSGAGKYVSGFVNFFNPNSSTDGVNRFTWHVSSRKHDQYNGFVIGGGGVATNTARTGFKIKCNSGNLAGGRIVVYGITNPS